MQSESCENERMQPAAVEDRIEHGSSMEVGKSLHIVGVCNVGYHIEDGLNEATALWRHGFGRLEQIIIEIIAPIHTEWTTNIRYIDL